MQKKVIDGKLSSEPEKKQISGVFSLQEVRTVGTGTTTRKTVAKSFWFADELDSGGVDVQLLNSNYIPAGGKKEISMEEFLKKYSPEPEFYVSNVFPKMRELNKTVARADRYRSNKEYYSAEMEYSNALKLDVENVKANFGLGLTYMERGENDKAENILERLINLDAAFDKEHKHLFNDFGISLRKSGMTGQAVDYYKRALKLSDQDENLYYNLARAYLECKDIENTVECLLGALDINPVHEISSKFLIWLVQKNMTPKDQQPRVAKALQKLKEAMASGINDSSISEASPAEASPIKVKSASDSSTNDSKAAPEKDKDPAAGAGSAV